MIEINSVKKAELEKVSEKKDRSFHELIGKLTPSEIYLIMGATRGCDFSLPIHKKVFTARIRYLVFGGIVGGMVRERAELTLNDILGLIFEAFFIGLTYREGIYGHYLDHIQDALRILRGLTESKEGRDELVWLFDLTVLLRDISRMWGFDTYEKIRVHIAPFVNLDRKVKVEITLWRTPSELIKKLYKKRISLRDIISEKFFIRVREAFAEFLEAIRVKNYDTGLVDFVVARHPGKITMRVFHIINNFPELSIIVETGKEGEKRWSPST